MILSRKLALLSFVAAAVVLFKDFGCYTRVQIPKNGNGHCKPCSGCPKDGGRIYRGSNKGFNFVNRV